jgi:hypothetical protein
MANPFPFVAGSVLEAAELNGIGEKTTYTPTFTNLTVGNGTLTAEYFRVQNVVSVTVAVVFGSTTSISGDVTVTLPIARAGGQGLRLATAQYNDPGVQNFNGTVFFSTSVLTSCNPRTLGTNNNIGFLSSTVPFTWATGDNLHFSAQYEVA